MCPSSKPWRKMRQKNSILYILVLIWQFLAVSSDSHSLEKHQGENKQRKRNQHYNYLEHFISNLIKLQRNNQDQRLTANTWGDSSRLNALHSQWYQKKDTELSAFHHRLGEQLLASTNTLLTFLNAKAFRHCFQTTDRQKWSHSPFSTATSSFLNFPPKRF